MPRALISVSDKRGIVGFAQGLVETGLGGRLDRRHRRHAPEGRRPGHHGGPGDRFPRNPRRPGQDAAPADPRGPPGAARPRRRTARSLAEHGIVPFELRGGEPLSVPGHGRRARRHLRGRDREHRRGRAVDAPRRGQESPVRAAGGRSEGLRRRARDAPQRAPCLPSAAASSRPRSSPTSSNYDAAIASYLTPRDDGMPAGSTCRWNG